MSTPDDVARWTPEERQEFFEQVAAERNLTAIVVEKDFWVCWMPGILFDGPLRDAMVFKGGTSLSKVYGAIQRFSEDIDLCVNRAELGLSGEPTPEVLTSRKRRAAHADEAAPATLGEHDPLPHSGRTQPARSERRRSSATSTPTSLAPSSLRIRCPLQAKSG